MEWIIGFCFFVGVIILVNKQYAKNEAANLAAIGMQIVNEHALVLRRRMEQTVTEGAYGETIVNDWHKEQKYFFYNIFSPLFIERFPNHVRYTTQYLEQSCYNFIAQVCANTELPIYEDGAYLSDPIEFERWCAQRLRDNGWRARMTKGSGDQGVDVFAEKDGRRIVLQCKLYSNPVGNKAVQEAHAAKVFENANAAFVVTNSSYTKSARALAQRTGVRLIHMDELLNITTL